jgi:hypothetical protein
MWNSSGKYFTILIDEKAEISLLKVDTNYGVDYYFII